MNKRVYGVLGVVSKMANWNADFSGYPKSTSNGDVYGSDKAFKYPIKKMWEENGDKVLYIRSYKMSEKEDKKKKETDKSLTPRTLKDRYEQIYAVENLKNCCDTEEILKNLFLAKDVKNFGATFAEEGKNISITGAVQIGQGFNLYEDTTTEIQQILSPFQDGKAASKSKDGEEAKSTTLGTKITSDEAHYFYPFAINPNAYKNYVELKVTEGYTDADYEDFKKSSLCAATAVSTNAKLGCDNEFGLFVETESNVYLPILTEYIEFHKTENKNMIDISLNDLMGSYDEEIKSVEIYYNPKTTEVKCDFNKAKMFNIFTRKEV